MTVCQYTKIVALKLKTAGGKNVILLESKGRPCRKDLHTKPKAKAKREKQKATWMDDLVIDLIYQTYSKEGFSFQFKKIKMTTL